MTERERIILRIENELGIYGSCTERIADFIIKDRLRVVEPLKDIAYEDLTTEEKQVLKLAGAIK